MPILKGAIQRGFGVTRSRLRIDETCGDSPDVLAMNGFVRLEIEDRTGGEVFGNEGFEVLFRQFLLGAAAHKFNDIPLRGGDQRWSVSAGFNLLRRAVVRQNP